MQQLLKFVQHQSFTVLTAFALLSAIGLALIPRQSLQYLPQYRQPGFHVQVYWQGSSPKNMELEVVAPLEAVFALIQGVEKIYSISETGSARISLDVPREADLDYLRFEVASKIRQVYPKFPEGVSYPVIQSLDPDQQIQDRPILTYSLGSTRALPEVYRHARDQLSPLISLVDGVERVSIVGGQEWEWTLRLDEDAMWQHQLSRQDLIRSIRNVFEDQIIGIGTVDLQTYTIRISNLTNAGSSADWHRIPVAYRGQKLIWLTDVANISREEEVPQRYYRINGQHSIRLLIYPEEQVNHLQLANAVKAKISILQKELSSSYQLFLDDDATEYLRLELAKIQQRTLWSLALLLFFLALVYFNVRYFLTILLSLLVTLSLASIFYYLFKVQLHLYALAGITVSFGVVIDNAIVLSHHLYRQKNLYVFPALLAAALTTLASLVVIFFLPERWQANLADFAKVIGINLIISLIVALVFIPALLHRLDLKLSASTRRWKVQLSRVGLQWYGHIVQAMVRRRAWVLTIVILMFGTPIFMLPNQVEGWKWYNQSIGNDWFTENIRPTLNRVFGGTLRLFVWYVYEGSTYREPDETILHVRASLPPGSTIHQMNTVMGKMENYLRKFPEEIKKYVANIFSANHAQLSIYFNPGHELTFPFILKNRLISFSTNSGGVSWNIFGVGRGFNNASGGRPPRFKINVFGYNDDELLNQAQIFADLLLEHPRIQSVDVDASIEWFRRDEYAFHLALDYQQMANHAVSTHIIRDHLQHYDQNTLPDFYLPGRQAVRFESADRASNDLWRWQNKIHQFDSLKFQFASLGSVEKKKMAAAIHKENQQYIRSVAFEYTGSQRFGSQYLDLCMEQMEKILPIGYTMEQETYSFFSQEQQRRQYGLLLLIVLLIFFICSIHFESFQQAAAIIMLIPISFIGIFLTFYWFDGSFDQGGYTSFILLSGLVVNSLILIFNDYNFFRKENSDHSSLQCYLQAVEHKFMPIMLTILTTALGMVPFLMHGRQEVFWYALSLGTIGGLLFSVIVILFVIPVFLLKKI